jgi:hypothetical protein
MHLSAKQMSHRWTGYWEQQEFGRQPMENLVLQFHDGQIHGRGEDIIGPFISPWDRGDFALCLSRAEDHSADHAIQQLDPC